VVEQHKAARRTDKGIYCDTNERIKGSNSFKMNNIAGKYICGRRGGKNFSQLERPDLKTKACPVGLKPCSKFTSLENTVCIDKDESPAKVCPITEIKFLAPG